MAVRPWERRPESIPNVIFCSLMIAQQKLFLTKKRETPLILVAKNQAYLLTVS